MKINNATKIGFMVIAAGCILLFMTVKAANFNLLKKGYIIKVEFKDIDGVDTNSPVMFNGFEVGQVESVDIVYEDEIKMVLNLFLNANVRLKEGTKAYIKNLGFMGEKYIALSSTESKGSFIEPGTVLQGQQPTDFAMLMTNGNEFITKLNLIADNVNERIETNKDNIDGILINANSTLSNLTDISKNINETLAQNDHNIDSIIGNFEQMTSNLNSASSNLEDLSLDLKLNPWKLLRKAKDK